MSEAASENSESLSANSATLKAILKGEGEDEDCPAAVLPDDFEPLEDLDDDEYSLPAVENTQTLEEILGEDEEEEDEDQGDGKDEDEEEEEEETRGGSGWVQAEGDKINRSLNNSGAGSLLDSLSVASGGSGGSRSRGSRSRRARRGGAGKRRQEREIHGTIMRHVILRGVSSQMSSACGDRVDAGLPTCFAASDLIAVGTAHGFVLVFDSAQLLRWSLGGRSFGQEHGSVSALSFSPDSSRLLAGFAKGLLAEFDVASSGKLVQTLADAHPIGSAVTHVRFTDDATVALAADSGGSVFEITFRRKLPGIRGYTSRCVFSGSRGEVCAVEPLSLFQHPGHFLTGQNVVALATISKVIVLSLRPSLRVLFSHPLTGSPDTLPVMSWQFVIVKTSSRSKVVDPVLAFGRQRSVFFYQVTESLSARPAFVPLQRLDLGYDMLSLTWLNTRCLAVVDTEEVFHLQDVKNREELETVDLSDVRLVYGSSFFKGLATGGNVSKAMARAGERAVYGSFETFTDQLLVLGRQSFHVLVIRTWHERLDHLAKAGEHGRALDLCRDFMQDHGRALVGLRGPRERRRAALESKLLSLLDDHLEASVTVNFPREGGMQELAEHYGSAVPPAVDACLALKKKDILFGKVWETFLLDPFARAAFLEALEPYVLSDQLRNMPVGVCQEFVKHYEAVGKLEALEASITHLNVTSLDIHQVMSLCWQHGLFEAVIYVHNNGMLDYVTPAEELLSQLSGALDAASEGNCGLTQRQVELGNKILVYISCCLAGRAFPHGDIPSERIAQVKYDVYTCLTALHTKKARDDESPYPHLRTLLRFDCQGLLNVVEMAFEEPEFRTETGQCQKQRLVDILLQIMVRQGEGDMEGDFSATQVGHLFTFLARRVAAGDKGLQVSRDLFDRVLDVLTSTADGASKSHREERQQALLEMLGHGRGVAEHFDRERLLAGARRAGFTRILEKLHEDAGEQDAAVRCHLEHATEEEGRMQAFTFAQKILSSENAGEEAKGKVEKAVVAEVGALTRLSPARTAALICGHMRSYARLVLAKLENAKDDALLYSFLKSAYELRSQASPVKSATVDADDCSAAPATAADPLSSEKVFERYVDLMCSQDPEKVAATLRSSRDGASFDAARMLAVVRRHGNVDAEAHLLEREGRAKEASELLRARLKRRLEEVGKTEEGGYGDMELTWSRAEAEVIGLVQLLQRARSATPEERKEMWFSLLDMLLAAQESASSAEGGGDTSRDGVARLKEWVRHVVNSTLGHVPLRTALERVLRHPAYQGDRVSFGEVRSFLAELLAMYHYEETLLRSTVQLVQGDLHRQVKDRHAEARRGIRVSEPISCDLCSDHLARRGGRAVVFRCGHAYHSTPCLERAGCVWVNRIGEEEWQCYRCMTADNRGVELRKEGRTDEAVAAAPAAAAAAARPPALSDALTPDQLESIVNRRLVQAKLTTDALKTSEPPLTLLDRMAEKEEGKFVRADEFAVDQSSVSVFARRDFALKLWPGLREEDEE